ncbi:HIRAN domain-containing protein [Actinokineospora sp.]|uniref:HIRAN domain-containing protein n=1 Tax=Actinokineospora sp. TaxID=1872133 RepID=UPI004037AC93
MVAGECAVDGFGISVEFDGHRLVVLPTNASAEVALGISRLVVAAGDVSSVSLHDAGLLRNGRLDLVVRTGLSYHLHFTRAQQPAFAQLSQGLLAARADGAAAGPAAEPRAAEILLRGSGYFNRDVVGESQYFRALRILAGRASSGERETTAELRREPENRHDGNAVQVVVEGRTVGYLPREVAGEYHVALDRVTRTGRTATCRARLWWSHDRDDFIASVSLDLADPAVLLPINTVDEDSPHLLVPVGRFFQVTHENEHMDVLGPLMDRAYLPGRALAFASLLVTERVRPRSTSHVVAVRVDGQEIGELTRQTSLKVMSLVRPLQEVGVTCYAEAHLTGNALAVQARLHLTPPEELPPAFIERVQRELRRPRMA